MPEKLIKIDPTWYNKRGGRHTEIIQHEMKIQDALKKSAKKNIKRDKRPSVDFILQEIDLAGVNKYILRDYKDHEVKSYNAEKQKMELIKHMFVKYPMPYFMYGGFFKTTSRREYFENRRTAFRQWFVQIAQGASAQKLLKDILTKREVVLFLTKSRNDFTIVENMWLAKLVAIGIPQATASKLIERIYLSRYPDDPDGKLMELAFFFLHYYRDMDKDTFNQLVDFSLAKLGEPDFRFKGRTLNSMVKLSNDWHIHVHKGRIDRNMEWESCGIRTWKHQDNVSTFTIQELLSNKELFKEGNKQHHCVYSYTDACVGGRSRIFSLRRVHDTSGEELTRVTIEINPNERTIVQVRGRMNKSPEDYEWTVIRLWAGEKGLRVKTRWF